jgi:hypothetical protein
MKKRIVMLVVVALVMAAMMLASTLPVFAAPNCEGIQEGSKVTGQHRAHNNAFDRGDFEQDEKHNDKHNDKERACTDDLPPGEGHNK